MSPALAFGWYIWTRHRRGLTILGGCWLALIVLCRSLAATDLEILEIWCGLLLLASGVGFAFLGGIFTYSHGARLEARESCFPARLRHLPLRTAALVGWPMLWGTAALALAWLSLAWGLRPVFRNWPGDLWFGWLALLLALVLAWMQALVWSPLPLPWLRAVLIGPLLSSIVVIPLLLEERVVPPAIWRGVLAALLPAAYLTAVFGVSRARRGDVPRWARTERLMRPRWISATTVGRPFVSPARAQLWFEWRRCGLGFPLLLSGGTLAWLMMIPWTAALLDEMSRIPLPIDVPYLLREAGSLWLATAGLLLLPLVLAAACGPEIGKLPGRQRTRSLSSFLATRPAPVAMLIRAKLKAAALSTLAGWGVLAIVFSLWFALGGHAAEMGQQFEAMRQRHSPGPFWGCLVLLLIVTVGLTWLQMVKRMWEGLQGLAWVMASSFLGFASFSLLIHLSTEWLNEENRQTLADFLSWLAGAAVVLKILAAAWSLRALNRRRLVPSNILRGALLLWIVLGTGLFGVLYGLIPRERLPVSVLVLGIVVFLPLTRLALAPLALAWNRHR